jgi:hypothetical protein
MIQKTAFENVYLTKWRHEPWGQPNTMGWTRQGKAAVKLVTDAMAAGNTVSMRTHFDEKEQELMDAEITWDANQ